MDEKGVEIPASFFERLWSDKRRLAAVIAGAVALLALLAFLIVPLFARDDGPARDPSDGGLEGLEPSSTATGSVETSSAESTGSAEATSPADSTTDPTRIATPVARAKLIVYRRNGGLWVALEDGTSARRLVDSPSGAFALSPDGRTLAFVDAESHMLHLVEVANASDMGAGPAEDDRISWAPDSAWLVYTAKAGARFEVRRIPRDGQGVATVVAGHGAAVSGDGSKIACIGDVGPGQSGVVTVVDVASGVTARIDASTANEVVWGGDGLAWAVSGNTPGSERIVTAKTDGTGLRELVGTPATGKPVMYTSLKVAPGGAYLLYAATGDDGYSRASTVRWTDRTVNALSVRRDTYPLQWDSTGSRLYFVEGNAWQGEATTVWSCAPDGIDRATVVEGGGL